MQISGKIKKFFEEQTFGSGFRKKELVVVTQEQYPQQIIIEFVQDKIDLLGNYREGDDVTVSINIKGREWINAEGVAKYFNSIQGWRVEKMSSEGNLSVNNVSGSDQENKSFSAPVNLDTDENEVDDLPF